MPAIAAPGAQAAEKPQEWELVNPAGIIEKASVDPAKRIASLDGKTIALRWNSKHNGDVVLNRLAELLAKKYPSATIVKTYETDKSLNAILRDGRRIRTHRQGRGLGEAGFWSSPPNATEAAAPHGW